MSATLSIQAEDFFSPAPDTSPQGRRSALSTVHAQAFSFSDVKAIKIDIKEKDTGNVLLVNFDLLQATAPATGWSGTIPTLPKGKALTFTARALNSSSPTPAPTVLFVGSTDQTLTLSNQTVSIVLAPNNDGQSITLPRIVRISIPSTFTSSQANNISFAVEASTGENLKYTLSAATSGGAFYPPTGALTLSATAGTFVSQYLPPTVSVNTVFEHSVTVTNAAGNSVTTTFKTTVKPPGSTDSVGTNHVTVLFNPVFNALNGSRVGSTSDVVFTATVVDDSPESQLTYAWSFTPTSGTFTTAPTMEGTTKSGTLHNYTSALQGTLKVVVTDPDGGATTLFYPLIPNEFPDNPYVEGDSSGLNSIRAGASHTCALFNNGSVRCWGFGNGGQLGYGNTFNVGDTASTLPYTAGNVPFVGKATQLAVGANHTCVLLDSGYVACWGRNKYGQLGYNTTDNVGDSEAVSSYGYVNLGGTATKITAGQNHTCALMDTGKVRCWGLNSSGQLGYGHKNNIGDNEQPWTQGDVQVGAPVTDIIAGAYHTCALLNTGAVRCWGSNAFGQLGYGNTTAIGDDEVPASVGTVNLSGGNVLQISAGAWHTCVLLDTGNIRCWGLNSSGQLGYGNTTDLSAPAGDVSVGGRVLQVATGSDHTCALLESGNIKCWGYGEFGQLGYASTALLSSPPGGTVQLQGSTSAYQITAGAYHTCALLGSGAATCWGLNNSGQLGYGNTNNIGDNEQPSSAGAIKVLAP